MASTFQNTGNQNVADQVEVMELTQDSKAEQQKHERLLFELEAKKKAFQLNNVPTLPAHVRSALRNMGLPVRLFGENLANVRDRLRMELAKREILKEKGIYFAGDGETGEDDDENTQKEKTEEIEETKYTRAESELILAREAIARFSLARAQQRLATERRRRLASKRKRSQNFGGETLLHGTDSKLTTDEAEIERLDSACTKLQKSFKNMALEASQYGDARALSALATCAFGDIPLIATGSWSGSIKLWDGSSTQLDEVGKQSLAHEDRIMGIDLSSSASSNQQTLMLAATASIDLTAKLWKIVVASNDMKDGDETAKFELEEMAHYKGHRARLCKVAFHPMGKHVATTSFDHTWRLWDVETGAQLLLQDGHAKECFGIGFHPDGSLVATTDFESVVQNWDLRTGKSVCHLLGHAGRVLCAVYAPNGFHLATAGDDGTIKVWDLRKAVARGKSRGIAPLGSIPAHSKLISQLDFTDPEVIASCSFDGTAKIWSTRNNFKGLATLRGHEGKVMGGALLRQGIQHGTMDNKSSRTCYVTSGYDKTLKLYQ